MDGIILDILDDIRQMCTHCGECCIDEFFFLIDVEHSMITKHLHDLGGNSLVKNHIRENPTSFNKWGRFMFHFEEDCPFHLDSKCSIYNDRPMSCRIYPFKLVGIFDNENTEIREPFFASQTGKEAYACKQTCQQIIDKMNDLAAMHPQVLMSAQALIVASLLDEKSLCYCYGKAKQRGDEYINTAGMAFQNEVHVEAFLIEKLLEVHKIDLQVDWHNYCNPLNDELIGRLASSLHLRKAKAKTSKRLKRLKEINPRIYEWHKKYPI